MERCVSWERWGGALQAAPRETLAAFLGDETAQRELQARSLPITNIAALRRDPVFDPNPHDLELSDDITETSRLVQALALWGPEVLMWASVAAAALEMERSPASPDHQGLRKLAFSTAKAHLEAGAARIGRQGKTWYKLNWAVRSCRAVYEQRARANDGGKGAAIVVEELGAAWFAAETVAARYESQPGDGPGPPEASPYWLRRNAVHPVRAALSAAVVTSHAEVQACIRDMLLRWANQG